MSAEALFQKMSRAVVVVNSLDSDDRQVSFGSGVVLSPGIVVTNWHVVEAATKLTVSRNGKAWPATVQYEDMERDLCQLAVEGIDGPPVPIRMIRTVRVGEAVHAIGSPQGLELSLSSGLVAGIRHFSAGPVVQTTAPISPGSSGGGLFDSRGRLIGLTMGHLGDSQNLNFAVPASQIGDLKQRASDRTLISKGFEARCEKLRVSGRWTALLALSKKWAARAPGDSGAGVMAAVALERLGRFDAADKLASLALPNVREPKPKGMLLGARGHARLELGNPKDAAVDLAEATVLDDRNQRALAFLGIALGRLGLIDKSLAAIRRATDLGPLDADLQQQVGSALLTAGLKAEAREAEFGR